MEAVFEVKNIRQQWKPPFKKKIVTKEVAVPLKGSFEQFKKANGNVFKVVKLGKDNASIWYSEKFTIKGHSNNPRDRIIRLNKGESASFTYLWGEDGTTKKITLKKIV